MSNDYFKTWTGKKHGYRERYPRKQKKSGDVSHFDLAVCCYRANFMMCYGAVLLC